MKSIIAVLAVLSLCGTVQAADIFEMQMEDFTKYISECRKINNSSPECSASEIKRKYDSMYDAEWGRLAQLKQAQLVDMVVIYRIREFTSNYNK